MIFGRPRIIFLGLLFSASLYADASNQPDIDSVIVDDKAALEEARLQRICKQINAINAELDALAYAINSGKLKVEEDAKHAIVDRIKTIRVIMKKIGNQEIIPLDSRHLDMLFDINRTIYSLIKQSLEKDFSDIEPLDENALIRSINRKMFDTQVTDEDITALDHQIYNLRNLYRRSQLSFMNKMALSFEHFVYKSNLGKAGQHVVTAAKRVAPYAALGIYYLMATKSEEIKNIFTQDNWLYKVRMKIGGFVRQSVYRALPSSRRAWWSIDPDEEKIQTAQNNNFIPPAIPPFKFVDIPDQDGQQSRLGAEVTVKIPGQNGAEPYDKVIQLPLDKPEGLNLLNSIFSAWHANTVYTAGWLLPYEIPNEGTIGTPLWVIRSLIKFEKKPLFTICFTSLMLPIVKRDVQDLYNLATHTGTKIWSYLKGEKEEFSLIAKKTAHNIGIPTAEHRKKFFQYELDNRCCVISEFDCASYVAQTDGCSYEQLESIISKAAQIAQAYHEGLAQKHIDQALDQIVYKIAPNSPLSVQEKTKVSVYWAGKALAHMLLAPEAELVRVTILPVEMQHGKQHGAIIAQIPDNYQAFATDSDIEKQCLIELAGVAAQKLKGCVSQEWANKANKQVWEYIKGVVLQGIDENCYSKEDKQKMLVQVKERFDEYQDYITALLAENAQQLEEITLQLRSKLTLNMHELMLVVKPEEIISPV